MQREENRKLPLVTDLKGEFILTNCMSFCLYCDTLSLRFPPLFCVLYLFSNFSPSPILHLSLSTPRHSPFLPARSLFFLPVATSLTDVSRAVLCTDATNQAAHSSRVICVTDSWKRALSPLLCLHWQLPFHLIIAKQIRLELGQVTQWWINGRWL